MLPRLPYTTANQHGNVLGLASATVVQVTENPVGYTVGVLPSVPSAQAYHVPGTDGVLTYAPQRFVLT